MIKQRKGFTAACMRKAFFLALTMALALAMLTPGFATQDALESPVQVKMHSHVDVVFTADSHETDKRLLYYFTLENQSTDPGVVTMVCYFPCQLKWIAFYSDHDDPEAPHILTQEAYVDEAGVESIYVVLQVPGATLLEDGTLTPGTVDYLGPILYAPHLEDENAYELPISLLAQYKCDLAEGICETNAVEVLIKTPRTSSIVEEPEP